MPASTEHGERKPKRRTTGLPANGTVSSYPYTGALNVTVSLHYVQSSLYRVSADHRYTSCGRSRGVVWRRELTAVLVLAEQSNVSWMSGSMPERPVSAAPA
jgi:hypothetical protein